MYIYAKTIRRFAVRVWRRDPSSRLDGSRLALRPCRRESIRGKAANRANVRPSGIFQPSRKPVCVPRRRAKRFARDGAKAPPRFAANSADFPNLWEIRFENRRRDTDKIFAEIRRLRSLPETRLDRANWNCRRKNRRSIPSVRNRCDAPRFRRN